MQNIKVTIMNLSLHPGGTTLTLRTAQRAGLSAGDKVLDVGCGTGASLAVLKDIFGIVPYGADISEKILELAEAEHSGFTFSKCDAASLPYPDGFFDAVIMECVLALFDDPSAALSEASRVLKPGGKLLISTLTAPDASELVSGIEAYGFQLTASEDNKKELTDYIIETIMEYGSLEERIAAETELTGASVFDCSCSYDPKNITYCSFVFQKTDES